MFLIYLGIQPYLMAQPASPPPKSERAPVERESLSPANAAAAVVRDGSSPPTVDDAHRLPPHRNKISRIQTSAEGAVEALKEWVELRIELVKTEIEETIVEKQLQARFGAILGFIGLLAVFMLLLVAGFGASATVETVLGWGQLVSLTAGYGIVLVVLILAMLIVLIRSPFTK